MAKNFSREFADKLLDKLSTDDNFRDHFKRDMRSALRTLGHETTKGEEGEEGERGVDPIACLSRSSSGELASKEDIKAARSLLAERLSSSPFHYDVVL